jgi:hypothetical protein
MFKYLALVTLLTAQLAQGHVTELVGSFGDAESIEASAQEILIRPHFGSFEQREIQRLPAQAREEKVHEHSQVNEITGSF